MGQSLGTSGKIDADRASGSLAKVASLVKTGGIQTAPLKKSARGVSLDTIGFQRGQENPRPQQSIQLDNVVSKIQSSVERRRKSEQSESSSQGGGASPKAKRKHKTEIKVQYHYHHHVHHHLQNGK